MSSFTKTLTTQQPTVKTNTMVPYHDLLDEKSPSQHLTSAGHCEANTPCHRRCHKDRLRRFLIYLVAILLGAVALLSISCMFDIYDVMSIGTEGLAKRATGNDPFIDRKLYLIVVFVGLVFVVILGIFLAAWCCKGSFENPLCCPCYLCACCGGMACLECVGCGLCCDGVNELSDG